jgi:hypothetical protein
MTVHRWQKTEEGDGFIVARFDRKGKQASEGDA